MSELILWTSREMNRLRRDVDKLLERLWVCFAGGAHLPGEMKGPYFEMIDEGDQLVVIAELPGASPEDVNIWVKNDMLYIECEKRSTTQEIGLFHKKIHKSFSNITKSIRLPSRTVPERVTAEYANGVFRIVMPKATKTTKGPIKISVK